MMYPLVSSIGTTCLNGWGEKILIVNIFQDVVAFLILNLSILTICITIEFLVESKAISLILNILLIGVGTEILIGISRELPVLEKILDITPIGKVKLIGRTVMKTTDFVTMVVTALIFGGVVLMIGADRFRKSDIK